MAGVLRLVGSGNRGLARAGVIASFPVSGMKEIRAFLLTHSTLAAEFGRRIGLDAASCFALQASYERWDGKVSRTGSKGMRSRWRRAWSR